ncbi:MAG: flagellar hook capping FlgD N-terminal domain-containing protein [Thermodesulfobacteriota bacterium]
MATVSGLGNYTTPASGLYQNDPATLGKQDFLILLVTQLQNQDPLNPADSTEFIAQLAQFSTLEQMQNVNQNLEIIQLYEQSINNAQALTFIGKNVKAGGNSFKHTSGEAHEFSFVLAEDVDAVHIKVYNSKGDIVAQVDPGAMPAGEHTIPWDGTDINGDPVETGTYTFKLTAEDAEGKVLSTAIYIQKKCSGVAYHDGNTFLIGKDGTEIPYSLVMGAEEVSEEEQEEGNSTEEDTQ